MAGLHLFVIAGEASGDRLGADLMRGLKSLWPDTRFSGIGGPMMAAEGLQSRFAMDELSVMGLTEIVPHIPGLLRRIRETVAAISAAPPDALITIDSPGFCFRVARKAKAANPGLPTIHFVAPSVWAWRPGRAAHMARFIDHVLALLPFEPPFMTAAGMTCDFVGHPVVAERQAGPDEVAGFRRKLGLRPGQKLLTLLPGSRAGELDRLLPVFSETASRLQAAMPGLAVVVPAAPGLAARLYEYFSRQNTRFVVLDPDGMPVAEAEARKRACLAASHAALAASGTVSLELAVAGTPMVIAYRSSALTTFLVRRMALVDTACLVNIVSGTKVVPEFLFDACDADRITPAVADLLENPEAADAQKNVFAQVMQSLGAGGEAPGLRAARSVLRAIRR